MTEFRQEQPIQTEAQENGRPGKRTWQTPVFQVVSVPDVTRQGPGFSPDIYDTAS